MTKKPDLQHLIQDATQQFMDKLGLSQKVKAEIVHDEAIDSFQVVLEASDPALIIGYHGETLSALQLFLNLHLHAQTNTWHNISINVNDYRQRREASLHTLADSAVARVVATGAPHTLPPMPSSERRVVHMYLSENAQVTTSSEGVGRSRCVVVSPKS